MKHTTVTETFDLNATEEVTILFASSYYSIVEYRLYDELAERWLVVDLDLYAKAEPEYYADLIKRIEKLEPKAA